MFSMVSSLFTVGKPPESNFGTFRIYDLKTVTGKASVRNRLLESIGQANQVVLNMATNYNARQLAKDLMYYFHINPLVEEDTCTRK